MILEIDANSKGDPNNHINQKNHSSDKRIQNYDLNDKMKTMNRHENHTNHTNQKNHSSDKYRSILQAVNRFYNEPTFYNF